MEGFDLDRLDRAVFKPRTSTVPLPHLKDWFPPEVPPAFEVRGLDGVMWAKVQEAESKAKHWADILEGFAGDSRAEKVEAMKALMGITGDVPASFARRIEVLHLGIVSPDMDTGRIVKFATNFPEPAQLLFTEIISLTGMGLDPGKSPGSGATPASEPPSPSGNETDNACSNSSPADSPKES